MSNRTALVAGLLMLAAVAQAAPPTSPIVIERTSTPGVYSASGTVPPAELPPLPGSGNPVPVLGAPVAGVPAVPAPVPVSYAVPCGAEGCGPGKCAAFAFYKQCVLAPATVPPPLGSAVRNANDGMRLNAMAEYFVVYREDFDMGTAFLNPSGERHVGGIIRRLNQSGGAPVRVEPTADPKLDERRKGVVIDALLRAGMPLNDAVARVTGGTTRAEGLRNLDIDRTFARYLYSGTYGYGGGGFGGGFGGFGGFGGGFGYGSFYR